MEEIIFYIQSPPFFSEYNKHDWLSLYISKEYSEKLFDSNKTALIANTVIKNNKLNQ